jgi:tetratricopeptide (TPR) repeat protein
MDMLEYSPAQVDLERAVAMDPGNSHAISARGWIHFRTDKPAEARRDFVAALALDQDNAEAIAGLGACALLDGDAREAVHQFDKALTLVPDYRMARSMSATAHMHAGNLEQSLADSALVLRAAPTDVEILRLRVQLRAMRREWPEVRVETDQLALALPTLSSAQQFAASAYSTLLLDDLATAAATRALSAWKNSDNYLLRADVRPWMDLQGRHADIAAALVLEPQSPRALVALGELESRVGNHEVARQVFTNLLQVDTRGESRAHALVSRGIESYHVGDLSATLKDFDAAPGPNPKATLLNALCWQLMAARVALDRAIGYCNRAIEQQPRNASFIDSKATLMLRLGRWSDAIRLYDEALALAPNHANSWYGRGIAVQSRCKCMDGSADLDKALHILPSVQRGLDRMGFIAPYPPAIPVDHPLP